MLAVAITGANSGIGLRAAQRLAAGGHRVVAICRDRARGEAALDLINQGAAHPAQLVLTDLADPESIDETADWLKGSLDRLDVLINNAAVFDQEMRKPVFTAAGHELFWATNHLGPFQLTARLSGLLAAAPHPRVISVASKGLVTMPRIRIRFAELDSGDWYSPTKAYYHAKLAQIMFSYSLAERAYGTVEVACVRVPAVRLDPDRVAAMPALLRILYAPKNRAAMPSDRLGEVYARLATRSTGWWERADRDGDAVARLREVYIDENERPAKAPAFAYDVEARQRLWDVSQEAAGNPDWAW